ncbi:MAG: Gfo/Idh/MocA family oxidoreductase [Pirellulaceae bacterium]
MKKLRVAVIGGGHLGRIHARLMKQNKLAKLVAVCDPQPLVQQRSIDEFDVRAVSDYQKIVDEFDAAVIATPSALHADVALRLIEQGKHLLIEKPVTVDSHDAREIADRAAAKGVCVQVGHVERFNASVREALKHVGRPRYLESVRMSGFTFRSTDIGVVHDLMVHDIDLACHMFDSPVLKTNASGVAVLGHQEDIAEARLEFGCGAVANLRASRCSFENERSLRIFGTQGFAAVNLTNNTVNVVRVPEWVQQREVDFLALAGEQQGFVREHLFSRVLNRETIQVTPVNAIEMEQTDWLQAIAAGRQPAVTADQAARNVEVAERIIADIETRSWDRTSDAMIGAMAIPSDVSCSLPIPVELNQTETTRRAA